MSIQRQADGLSVAVRSGPDRISGHSHHNGIAAAEIDRVERLINDNGHVNVLRQFIHRDDSCAWTLVAAVANQRLKEGHLKGSADIKNAKAMLHTAPWVGESAG